MQQETYGKLLALNYNLFELSDYEEIVDYIVNDSHKVLPYQLALVYEIDTKKSENTSIVSISGTLGQEINVSFKNWLDDTVNQLHKDKVRNGEEQDTDKPKIKVIHPHDMTDKMRALWAHNLGQEVLVGSIYTGKHRELYFLLINNEQYDQGSILAFNFILKSYQQSLKINLKDRIPKRFSLKNKIYWLKVIAACFMVAMFIPVKPSVLAPAEIISEKTWDIHSPIDGILKEVKVDPSSNVKQNQILFSFDQVDLRNNLRIKQQELKALETERNQARAEGFEDREQRAKIFRLQQQIATKKQEITYANERYDLSIVKSPASGTVLFKDKNELLGKPIKIGESVMRVADVNSSVVEVWLDVNDNMKLEPGMGLYYYSNTSPFRARPAKLDYFSYEAYVTPNQNIAFRLIAKLDRNEQDLIIGDHGKVKIYGLKKVFLGQFIFQKPIASLRQWFYGTI